MDSFIIASASTALITSTLLQVLKNTPLFPWLNRNTGKMNLFVSILIAGLTALGISYNFDYDEKTGVFAIGLHGSVSDMLHGIYHWVLQWSAQHGIYKGLLVPAETLGEIRAMLTEQGRVSAKPGEPVPTKLD